jgi:hypothetical protein
VGEGAEGAHEALPQTPPGGKPPETPGPLSLELDYTEGRTHPAINYFLDSRRPSHGSRDRKEALPHMLNQDWSDSNALMVSPCSATTYARAVSSFRTGVPGTLCVASTEPDPEPCQWQP